MFRITQKGSVVAAAAAVVVGSLVAVVGSLVVSADASAAAKPVQQHLPATLYLGEASLDDTGVLSLDVNQIVAARGAQALLLDREVKLLTGPATRITNVQGGLVARAQLDDAIVRVQGRLLPVGAWPLNDEGERMPTIRATRIVVVQLEVQDATDTPAQDGVEAPSQD